MGVLGHSDPEFAAGLYDIIVDDPNGALAPYLQPLLSNVRIWNAERARGIGQCVLKGDSNTLCCGLASSYQGRRWVDSANAQDIEHIERLLSHEDQYVKKLAIASLRPLAEASPKVAIDLTYWDRLYTPFQTEADAAPVRLIVRRVKPTPGSQLALFATYSYHGFITDRDGETLELEADHRRRRRDRERDTRPQVRRRAEPSPLGPLRRQRRLAGGTGDGPQPGPLDSPHRPG